MHLFSAIFWWYSCFFHDLFTKFMFVCFWDPLTKFLISSIDNICIFFHDLLWKIWRGGMKFAFFCDSFTKFVFFCDSLLTFGFFRDSYMKFNLFLWSTDDMYVCCDICIFPEIFSQNLGGVLWFFGKIGGLFLWLIDKILFGTSWIWLVISTFLSFKLDKSLWSFFVHAYAYYQLEQWNTSCFEWIKRFLFNHSKNIKKIRNPCKNDIG